MIDLAVLMIYKITVMLNLFLQTQTLMKKMLVPDLVWVKALILVVN